jgi:hypothetical protein
MNIDAEIDALFQLPLAEFTEARNALAKQLKKAGRTLDAERVKALSKPPAPAWAVNQLYWQDPQSIEELLALGERVRAAQTGRLKAVDLRALLEQKKQMTKALLAKATTILDASADSVRRAFDTLEALAAWGHMDGAPRAGRLTAALEPPGFDTLAPLMSGFESTTKNVLAFRPAKPVEDRRAVMRARLEEAVQSAEKTLRDARNDAERAESALAKTKARMSAVEKEKEEIEARYAEAKEAARVAADDAKKRASAVADAERLLAKAKAALETSS